MSRKLKTPADYPTLIFRISAEEKLAIMRDVALVKDLENKFRAESDFVTKKNEVILKALKIGLKRLLEKKRKYEA